ncbi:MAG: iron-sulfur cluster assembly scaffold protein, partial [Thermomicrobiales bacterium]
MAAQLLSGAAPAIRHRADPNPLPDCPTSQCYNPLMNWPRGDSQMNEPYSAQVIEHFAHPRNLGRLPEANGRGVAGDLRAGDVQIEIAILVEGD